MRSIHFKINDVEYHVDDVEPMMTLLQFLRERLQLTGTKEGCNEGDCGACTIIMVDDDGTNAKFRAVNSCLVLVPMIHNHRIYTVEALDKRVNGTCKRHLVQDAILNHYASQCGFCTPGIEMSLLEATYRKDMKYEWQFIEQMAGNLCRCTGYRPILEAVKEVAGQYPDDQFAHALDGGRLEVTELDYAYGDMHFFLPLTLKSLYEYLDKHPDAVIVSGSTDVSVVHNKHKLSYPDLISLNEIRELKKITVAEDGTLIIGASAHLTDLEMFCQEDFTPFARMLRYFASHQIKHYATVAGSVAGASPIGDMAPVLSALDAKVVLGSLNGERRVPMNEFLIGYRKTSRARGEAIIAFEVPPIPTNARIGTYKVSKRQELDISAVSACLYLETDSEGTVSTARFSYGGVAAKPAARATKAEQYLEGKPWYEASAEQAAQIVEGEFKPISDFRASAWYRSKVSGNLLRGFYHETLENFIPVREYRPTGTLQLTGEDDA